MGTARGVGVPLRFGVITDVQYADVDDAWNFAGTHKRAYRGVLESLRMAVREWLAGPPLSFVADLGDVIDQQCEANADSLACLARVLEAWKPIAVPVQHVMGNHELYNFNREECARLIPNVCPWYRSFRPKAGWRVLVLDAYELNCIEKGGGPAVEDGIAYLSRHNPNNLRAPRGTVDLSTGLTGLERRFLPMGGGVGEEQLQWLSRELQESSQAGERVVVLSHLPVLPEATREPCLMWNYDEVLEVLRREQETVALVMSGHDHCGGYAMDEVSGTHHVGLESPLGCSPESPMAHCTVEAFHDRIEIFGSGLVKSRTLPLRPPRAAPAELAAPPAAQLVAKESPKPTPQMGWLADHLEADGEACTQR